MPKEIPSSPTDSHTSSNCFAGHPYLWAAAPACALFAFTLALSDAPLPQPLSASTTATGASVMDTDASVPASETLIVAPQSTANATLLRGRLQTPAGVSIVATTDGQVAQVMVRAGQEVRSGQQILALSMAKAARNSELAPVENRQSRAEAAQIAAAGRQQAWQKRVRDAHDRLEAAQQRVQIAQERVAEARAVVRRLQNGESVSTADLAVHSESTPRHQQGSTNTVGESAAREASLANNQRLQARAQEVANAATVKRREAQTADAAAKTKHKQWLAAQDIADKMAIASVPAKSPSTPSGESADKNAGHAPDVDLERDSARRRAAQDNANSLKLKADAADARAQSLHREADRLAKRATVLRTQIKSVPPRIAGSLHNLRVFDNEDSAHRLDAIEKSSATHDTQSSTPANAPHSAERGTPISVAQAARLTQAAIAESRVAIADAERVRREVAGYGQPIESTREQFDDATRRLDAAQERVWDTASLTNPNVRTVMAKSDGVVLWVAEVARVVKSGDPIAAVGRADRLEVVLHDTSGAWKNVRPGNTLMALVQSAAMPTSQPIPQQARRGVPVPAKVLGVLPPQRPGQPATVRVAIYNPQQEANAEPKENTLSASQPRAAGLQNRAFAPGTPVICSLPSAGATAEIAIPSAAIRRDEDGSRYVAVLMPVADSNEDRCRIEWRRVQVGRGDGFKNLILNGLEIGDRIALRPAMIRSFLQSHGAQATLRIAQA